VTRCADEQPVKKRYASTVAGGDRAGGSRNVCHRLPDAGAIAGMRYQCVIYIHIYIDYDYLSIMNSQL